MAHRLLELLEDLRTHVPADATEAQHRRAIGDLLTNYEDAFSRTHYVPGHVTASCFIVDVDGFRILLHYHRRLGRWLQMGGHVEGDESPLQAALREGVEESGLSDLVLLLRRFFDVDVHAVPAGKGEPDHHHFDVRFLARTFIPASIRIDRSESNELEWVPIDRAASLMNEEASTRAIRKIEWVLRNRSLS